MLGLPCWPRKPPYLRLSARLLVIVLPRSTPPKRSGDGGKRSALVAIQPLVVEALPLVEAVSAALEAVARRAAHSAAADLPVAAAARVLAARDGRQIGLVAIVIELGGQPR